jgi:VanZ family protein
VRKIAENRILGTLVTPQAPEAIVLRILAYAPAMVWAALLLFVGGRSDVPTVETPLPLDKAAHFLLYGFLGALVARGWQWSQRWPSIVWPLLLAGGVGAADELHQRSVAGRSSEIADWIADAAGILTGCGVVLKLVKDSMNAD